MKIRMYQALKGDALQVSFTGDCGAQKSVFIDSGMPKTYDQVLRAELNDLAEAKEFVDLFVITHTDEDHIGGILKWFCDNKGYNLNPDLIRHFWVNTTGYAKKVKERGDTRVSARQGVSLERFLLGKHISWDDELIAPGVRVIAGAKFILLSPTRESISHFQEQAKTKTAVAQQLSRRKRTTNSISNIISEPYKFKADQAPANGASIAFLFEAEEKKVLFLGDAWPTVVADSLKALGYSATNPLQVDCIKLAHHGSRQNMTADLISMLKCRQFMISTNGRGGHPDKETLALIIKFSDPNEDTIFYFNYDNANLRSIFTSEDLENHPIKPRFPNTNRHYIDVVLKS